MRTTSTRKGEQADLQEDRLQIIQSRDLHGPVCDKILSCLKIGVDGRYTDFLEVINPILAEYSDYLDKATQEKINTKEAANLLRDLMTLRLLQTSIESISKKQAAMAGIHTPGRQSSDLLNELLRLQRGKHRDSAALSRRDSAVANILVSMLVDTVQNYSDRGYAEKVKNMIKGLFDVEFEPTVINYGVSRIHHSAFHAYSNQSNLFGSALNQLLDSLFEGKSNETKEAIHIESRQECTKYTEAIIEELCKTSGAEYIDIFAAHIEVCRHLGLNKRINAEELIAVFKENLQRFKYSSCLNSNHEGDSIDAKQSPSIATVMFDMHLKNIIRKLKTFLTSS